MSARAGSEGHCLSFLPAQGRHAVPGLLSSSNILITKVSDVITAVKVGVSRNMTCRTCLMDTESLHAQGSEERGRKHQALLAVLLAGIHKLIRF